jgi:hypothetical protein
MREFRQIGIAPGNDGWRVELVMRVFPGEHYERIFRDSLTRAGQLPPAVVPVLRQALDEVESARYELLRVEAVPAS